MLGTSTRHQTRCRWMHLFCAYLGQSQLLLSWLERGQGCLQLGGPLILSEPSDATSSRGPQSTLRALEGPRRSTITPGNLQQPSALEPKHTTKTTTTTTTRPNSNRAASASTPRKRNHPRCHSSSLPLQQWYAPRFPSPQPNHLPVLFSTRMISCPSKGRDAHLLCCQEDTKAVLVLPVP